MASRSRSSSAASPPPPPSHPLFSVHRLLTIHTQQPQDGHPARPPAPRVQIRLLSQGGVQGRSTIALYLSNGQLVFRFVGESGVPVVRQLAWFAAPQYELAALDFSPDGDWLLACTRGGSVYLVPVAALITKRQDELPASISEVVPERASLTGQQSQWLSKLPSLMTYAQGWSSMTGDKPKVASLADVTCLPTVPSARVTNVTVCLWWRSWEGHDHAIVGTREGHLLIVNVRTLAEHPVPKLKHAILDLALLTDSQNTFKYVLITTDGPTSYKLLLEQEVDYRVYITIASPNATRAQFSPVPVGKFPANSQITKQAKRGEPVLGVFHPNSYKYEVYDAQSTRFALFVYQLFPGTRQVFLTEKFLLAVSSDDDSDRISAVSTLAAGTSADAHWFVKHQRESIKQDLRLPPGSRIRGLLAPPPQARPSGIAAYLVSAMVADPEQPGGDAPPPPLEGCYFWTDDGLYELRSEPGLDGLFHSLVRQGLDHEAESLGKSLGLDLLTLCETAADSFFDDGEYVRALDLYRLSAADPARVVRRFMDAGRHEQALPYLEQILGDAAALSSAAQQRLSDLLLQCYINRVQADPRPGLVDGFHAFLVSNTEFNAGSALLALVNNGLRHEFLMVAHARGLMPKAIDILVNRGALSLSPDELAFIEQKGHTALLKTAGDGVLFSCLSPRRQIRLLLSDPATMGAHYWRIMLLLPVLTEDALAEVITFLDPAGEHQALKQAAKARASSGEASLAHPRITPTDLYLLALIELLRRQTFGLPAPSPLPASPELGRRRPLFDFTAHAKSIKIIRASCGFARGVALSQNGSVYTWGRNEHGLLGLGTYEGPVVPTPTLLKSLIGIRIAQVACGSDHSTALTESGDLFTWGLGHYGQLGHNQADPEPGPRIVQALFGKVVVQIAAGYNHTLAITQTHVYAFGCNSYGQLGLGDQNDRFVPVEIEAMAGRSICRASGGYCHTLLQSSSGDLFACGSNDHGQLGLDDAEMELVPRLVGGALRGKKVTRVACGAFHTTAITDIAGLYSWGKGSRSRLGFHAKADQRSPMRVQALGSERIVDVACGHWTVFALSDAGKVFVWGDGSDTYPRPGPPVSNRQSAGDPIEIAVPSTPGDPVVQLAAGEEHALFVTQHNNVWAVGRNDFGQLGTGDADLTFAADPLQVPALRCRSAPDGGGTDDGADTADAPASATAAADQMSLEKALREHFGGYRVTPTVNRCIDAENWSAASVLYELLQDWPEAVECRLRSLSRFFDAVNAAEQADWSSEIADALQMVLECLFRIKPVGAQAKVLAQVLLFWKDHKLPLAPLENMFMQHVDQIQAPLGILLSDHETSRQISWQQIFSPQLFLRVTQFKLAQLKAGPERSNADKNASKASEERLWSEIKYNLEKDIDNRDKIVLPIMPVVEMLDTRAGSNEGSFRGGKDAVAFTCGHFFSRDALYQSILPEFEQRAALFPDPLPVTVSAILADYHQSFVNLACPICLYNRLRQEQVQNHPTAQLKGWIL